MYLKLMRGMRRTTLAYVVWHHIKVAHIAPGSGPYLNLDKEMSIRSNLRLNQDSLDRVYLDHQADTVKIDNEMAYQIHSKLLQTWMLLPT